MWLKEISKKALSALSLNASALNNASCWLFIIRVSLVLIKAKRRKYGALDFQLALMEKKFLELNTKVRSLLLAAYSMKV